MPDRGGAHAPSEIALLRSEDSQHDCPFELVTSLPDTCRGLCHELAEGLTAAGNYLGAVQRLLDIGHRRGQPSPAELLDKAGSQITRAGEALERLRRILAAHQRG